MSPALVWKKSKEKHKRPFIADVDFLDRAFGAMDDGTLTTSGITFDHMTFHDPAITGELMNDLKKTAPKRKRRGILSSGNPRVMFKYNPVNMEAIYVWNSVSKKYVRLPNAAGEMAIGLSKWHWKILRLWAAQEQLEFVTPEQQAAARRRLRENIEATIPSEAYKTIKDQRRILHEPSEILEGKAVRMTTATGTVGGMGPDDIEIDVARHAPDGGRIPPRGPKRGRSKKKPRTRNTTRSTISTSMTAPPSDPRTTKAKDNLADIARSIFARRERIEHGE
jgi:putative transposase